MTKSVTVQRLNIGYGTFTIVKDLDLKIDAGEFIVLLGPSGCGKSTLLSAFAGLAEVQSGAILFGDRNVTRVGPKDRGIGMVFQSYALYPTMSVARNISFGLKMAGVSAAERDRKVKEVANFLQITPLLERKPSQLSGGQRQRVAIGRALAKDADIYLFDEPLSNLDAKLRTELRYEIRRLHTELGATMIYVTHDQIEAMTLATRIAVMKSGVIQQFAKPHDLYAKPTNLFVAGFVGSPAMNFIPGRIEVAGGGGSIFIAPGLRLELRSLYRPQKAVLGVRPEQFQWREGPIKGRIELVENMGAEGLFWLRVGEQKIAVRVTSSQLPNQGTDFSVDIDQDLMSLFSEETGDRIVA